MRKTSSWIKFKPVGTDSSGGGLRFCRDCDDRVMKFCFAAPSEVGTRCEEHHKLYIGTLYGIL
jgi:hypothetical protein